MRRVRPIRGERLGEDRVLRLRADELVDVRRMGPRLLRSDEPRAHPDRRSAGREGGGHRPPGADPAGRDDRHLGRRKDLAEERQEADLPPDVAARLGPVGHDQAAAAEGAGGDLIVAQGTEAGGHVRGKIGLLALLGQVLPSAKVPVVAAGGIGTGRAMAAALAAGASAVRVGTRFVAAEETGTHPMYVDKLIAAEAKDTILTEAFSANWPNAPHRVLRSCVEAVERFQGEFVGETVQPWAPDVRVPVQTRASFVADKTTTGTFDAMPLWAGESVDGVKRIQKAGEIVRELAGEAETLLRSWGT